jgi:KDO2-lipid IV(A) lauroyltransferase
LKWKLNILKNCYQFFMHNFIQFFSFPSSYFSKSISIKGKKYLDRAIKQGKGVIIITGHFGAFELLSAWLGYNGYPIIGVAHRQRNLGSDQFSREQREMSGFGHIFRKEPIEKMYQVLSEGKMLGLVSDQDAKNRGIFVNFLNQQASTPKGAAHFHKNTGAPMVFITCTWQSSNKYEINCEKVVSEPNDTVKDITQRYSTILEKIIKQHPEQYFWWHRRWKTKSIQNNGQ